MKKKEKLIIGWREWVSLPDLGIDRIKAKIDTGARTSSLHAFDVTIFKKNNQDYVQFSVHPKQRNNKITVKCESPILEYRKVKSSTGHTEKRPVIITNISLMDMTWPIEITLTNRSDMGFRMLLGRESFRKKFLVDAGNSHYGNKKIGSSSRKEK